MPVMSTQVKVIEEARHYLDLSYARIAEALRADESTLHRWRAGAEPSPVFLARLEALEELLAEMKRTFRAPEHARQWLHTDVPALKGERPIDLVARGRIEVLTGLLYALNVGVST